MRRDYVFLLSLYSRCHHQERHLPLHHHIDQRADPPILIAKLPQELHEEIQVMNDNEIAYEAQTSWQKIIFNY